MMDNFEDERPGKRPIHGHRHALESIEDPKGALMDSFTRSFQNGNSLRGQKLLDVGKQRLVTNHMNACLYIGIGHLGNLPMLC
jgi:hypothetical protein